MADYDVPPDHLHDHPTFWTRVFTVPQAIIKSPSAGGWQPFKHKTGEVDEHGQPVVVEFKTRQQHEEWMSDNGMVLTQDLRTPEIGESQHSVLDQKWAAPATCKDPDGLLKRMAEEMDFISNPEEIDPTIQVNEPDPIPQEDQCAA
jgi:hypothetical protein